MEGDIELNYAYYALHELNIRPLEFASMGRKERAAVMAFIDLRVQEQERIFRELQG